MNGKHLPVTDNDRAALRGQSRTEQPTSDTSYQAPIIGPGDVEREVRFDLLKALQEGRL